MTTKELESCEGMGEALRSLIEEAKKPHASGRMVVEKNRKVCLAKPQNTSCADPRRHPDAKELLYVSDGDDNGVCFFLGTRNSSGGALRYVNPCLTNEVLVTASSVGGRYSQPKTVTSRVTLSTSYFEPNETGQSFFQIDLQRQVAYAFCISFFGIS